MRQQKESVVVQLIGIWYLGKVTFSRWCVNTLNLFVIFMIWELRAGSPGPAGVERGQRTWVFFLLLLPKANAHRVAVSRLVHRESLCGRATRQISFLLYFSLFFFFSLTLFLALSRPFSPSAPLFIFFFSSDLFFVLFLCLFVMANPTGSGASRNHALPLITLIRTSQPPATIYSREI